MQFISVLDALNNGHVCIATIDLFCTIQAILYASQLSDHGVFEEIHLTINEMKTISWYTYFWLCQTNGSELILYRCIKL